MGRKVIALACCCIVLISAICGTAQAAEPYEGTISSTYLQYFRDIVSGIGFNDNYIAYRSGQYDYTMVVGKFDYDGNTFRLDGDGTRYTITNSNNYNSYYSYSVSTIENLSLTVGDKIIYSDMGLYPQLVDRGAKYETLTTYLLCIALLYIIISRIFFRR